MDNTSSYNNNGRVPIKIVQLLLDNMKLEFKISQEKISNEVDELTKALIAVLNKTNSSDGSADNKLTLIENKISKMILVVKVAFGMLMIAVMLAIFGSQILYKQSANTLIEKIIKEDKKNVETSKNLKKDELREVIESCIKDIKEERLKNEKTN